MSGTDSSVVVERVRAAMRTSPGLARVLDAVLDRRERLGHMPARITVDADRASADALRELLSTRAVRDLGGGRVRLDLARADELCRGQLGIAADALFYAALGRSARDPVAEETALRAAVCRGLDAVRADSASDAARAFIDDERAAGERGVGETYRIAGRDIVARAVDQVRAVAECIDGALANDGPIRMQNFAARVLGDSKALGDGSDLARRVGRALVDHHAATRDAVLGSGGDLTEAGACRLALEVNGIYRDEAALTAHCFGPLVYTKEGRRFDHVAAHAALGDAVPLSLAQLRGASLAELPVRRALVLENQTPFLDYVEALFRAGTPTGELVVLSRGQANWAVIQLLRMVSRAGVAIAHAGDLDRSGVLILRSLARRVFSSVEPVGMDVATHRRFRDRGRPLGAAERERLAALVAVDDAALPCHDLLREILETGIWLEQESFVREVLLAPIAHNAS